MKRRVLGLILLTAAMPATAQEGGALERDYEFAVEPLETTVPTTVQGCTELRQGVDRLDCYDRFLNSGQPIENESGADPELKEAAEAVGIDGEQLEESEQQKRNPSLVERLLDRQRALFSYSGSFVSHRPNYLLPLSYSDTVNDTPESQQFGRHPYDQNMSNVEAKFQLSFRLPLLTGIFNDRVTLWGAYTQVSFWQAYNSDESSPFRESNYEPEIFFSYNPGVSIGPGSFDFVSLGINHQSNGLTDPHSRSWNRILGNVTYSSDRWLFAVSPWYRLPESRNEDNNPDIHKYLGYADYRLTYKLADDASVGVLLRNNLDSDHNRTSFRLDYSYPLSDALNLYVQYYHGWGESLIDYNHHVKRIGIGVTLTDWL